MAKKKINISVEDKLKALYNLQCIDSEIDNIRIVRGELPIEIQDLEDELFRLETRLSKFQNDLDLIKDSIKSKKEQITTSQELIKKYTKQLDNIKNNREFTSLTKEIEFQELEIELSEKKIAEEKARNKMKKELINSTKETIEDCSESLTIKNKELSEITSETEKEEKVLIKKSGLAQKKIDDRLFSSYNKIRKNMRNGLAVVSIDRDACGGCYNKVPPQKQLDIKLHKKVIVCEHCGRVLIDSKILSK